jgi:hypothetical protein|tara:strand:+ start:323 stop:991 length:669 start_codon:yes stop_codon:yes gene_type:complete
MSFRYRQRWFEGGDALDPRDLNLNHAEYADELNGYLDRDNFPADFITSDMLDAKACNEFFTSNVIAGVALSSDTPAWQRYDSSGADIHSVSADLTSDALLMCEWSGSWYWSYDIDTIDNKLPDTTLGSGNFLRDPTDCLIRARMLVDGTVVAESGFSSARRQWDTAYLVGAAPAGAGLHAVNLEFQAITAFNTSSGTPFYYLSNDYEVTFMRGELIVRARYR